MTLTRSKFTGAFGLLSVIFALAFASTASAYCGPGFHNKKQALAYYKSSAGKAYLPSMKAKLVAKGFMHRDQDVMAFLESSQVVYSTTTAGYVLDYNTSCSGHTYGKYNGLYGHSKMGVLAVKYKSKAKALGKATQRGKSTTKVVSTTEENEPQANGEIFVYQVQTLQVTTQFQQKVRECTSYKPFMKGYCRNIVHGKKYQQCKTYMKKFSKTVKEVKRTLVRKIPPPPPSVSPTPSPTPTVTPSPTPTATPTPSCVINITIYGNGNVPIAACGNIKIEQVCSSLGYYWDVNMKVCFVEKPPGCSCTPPTCEETHTCPPPTCEETHTCPQPPAAECTGLFLTVNGTKTGELGTGLGVDARVTYTTTNTTLSSAVIYWGDGKQSNGTPAANNTINATHLYPRSDRYTVTAVLTFNGVSGSKTCTAPITVTLNCPYGNSPNPDKSQCTKDGTTTPPTPTPAPGPNPTPDPQDPAPGGHMCYSNTTGLPVDPVIVGGVPLCPPGSHGGV